MGLSITRGLLSAAGGRIWAENVTGGGARFSLVIPGAVRRADGGDRNDGRSGFSIVDDEPNILATVAPLLRAQWLRRVRRR